jgi:site-specific DNA recombinase
MKAVGYTRVSTKDQADEGISLDAQAERIRHYCQAKGLELLHIYSDQKSGRVALNRPGFQEMLEDLREKRAEAVVFFKLDRMFRSMKDGIQTFEDFQKAGVAVHDITNAMDTSTANGKLFFHIVLVVASWESDLRSERAREAVRYLKKHGRKYAHRPFGYAAVLNGDGKFNLVPDEKEQAIILSIRELRKYMTYQAIADRFNAEGVRGPRGGRWHSTSVRNIFLREKEC